MAAKIGKRCFFHFRPRKLERHTFERIIAGNFFSRERITIYHKNTFFKKTTAHFINNLRDSLIKTQEITKACGTCRI